MRTFSTIAIFALALTCANAATYTGDDAVPQSGSVQVGAVGNCPVRHPAVNSFMFVASQARRS